MEAGNGNDGQSGVWNSLQKPNGDKRDVWRQTAAQPVPHKAPEAKKSQRGIWFGVAIAVLLAVGVLVAEKLAEKSDDTPAVQTPK